MSIVQQENQNLTLLLNKNASSPKFLKQKLEFRTYNRIQYKLCKGANNAS